MQNPTYTSADTIPARRVPTEANSTIERIEEAVPKIKERFKEMVDAGEERISSFRHDVKDNIRQKPVQSFLVAAGIGAVVGLILGRSRR